MNESVEERPFQYFLVVGKKAVFVLILSLVSSYFRILFSVGPILLTIPSYLTFTVESQNVTINKTLTDESEVLKAQEAGYATYQTGNEGEWAMETEVPKYYMNIG